MYYTNKTKEIIGVLNDFDLARTSLDTTTGSEYTGTIPFMALDLLYSKEIPIKHAYEHDAESFIWVLVWISLQYDRGKLRQLNRPLDAWLRGDVDRCREKKIDFLFRSFHWDVQAGIGHEQNWELAKECMNVLKIRQMTMWKTETLQYPLQDVDTIYESMLWRSVSQYL